MNKDLVKQITAYIRETNPPDFNQSNWSHCFAYHAANFLGLPTPKSDGDYCASSVRAVRDALDLSTVDFYTIMFISDLYFIENSDIEQCLVRDDKHIFKRDPIRIANAIDKYVELQP